MKSVSQRLYERAIRLDRYYREADAATEKWREYLGKDVEAYLYERQKKLWRRYRRAVNRPMPGEGLT